MDYKDCASLLASNDDYLILTHKNPDGDSIGSSAALCSALRRFGKKAFLYANPDFNAKYLPYIKPFVQKSDFSPKYVIAIDIASESQFPKGFEGKVDLCIDHHPTNTHYASNYLVAAEKSACGEAVMPIIRLLCKKITKQEATLLYMAVSTDTGCFKYANTNAGTMRAAAELLEAGADNLLINEEFFRKVSRNRLALEGMIYSGLRYYRDGLISVASITLDMIRESGITDEDLDDLAALCGRARGSKLNITIRETECDVSRVSLRSAPGVDCSKIAAVFGGGGHTLASGCTIKSSAEKARAILLEVIDEVWK